MTILCNMVYWYVALDDNTRNMLIVLLLAALATIGGTVAYKLTRGIRNNNPGNIRKSADQWRGLATEQPDTEFFTFTSPVYGIRALAKILRNYQTRYGLNTIQGIINRWAPPTENITSAYVEAVAKQTGIPANATIDVNQHLFSLASAIIKHENGMNPYPADLIQQGIAMA